MANAKDNINISELQYGKSELVNKYLDETLTALKSQTDNFMIKSLLDNLGNHFNPYACRLLPVYKLDGNAKALCDEYFRMTGIKDPSIKDLSTFSKYNKDCVINQDILNKIVRTLGSGQYTDKSCANIFANTIASESSFFFSGFQLGMKWANLTDEQVAALIAKDCFKNPFTKEKKYGTPEDAKKFAEESQLMQFVKYCDRIGFIYEILHDDMMAFIESNGGAPYIPEGKIKEHLQIARTFLSPTLSPEANEQYQKLREIFPNGRVDYHSYMHKDDNTIDQGWMSEIYTVLSEGKTMSK